MKWKNRLFGAVVAAATIVGTGGAAAAGPEILYKKRVLAQEAIERVYYAHRTGAKPSFEEAVPASVIEAKVRRYLRETEALKRFWGVRVTGEMLRREAERIARGTRMPDRLLELYAVLGNDPVLIQECLARPVLVDRLVRERFSWDPRIYERPRRDAEALRRDLAAGRIDPETPRPDRTLVAYVLEEAGRRTQEQPDPDGIVTVRVSRDRLSSLRAELAEGIGRAVEERDRFVVRALLEKGVGKILAAVYTVPKESWDLWWRRVRSDLDETRVPTVASADLSLSALMPRTDPTSAEDGSAGSSCAPRDVWDNGILDDVPDPVSGHRAVWTGSEMLIWGGGWGGDTMSRGWRYDPVADSWTRMSDMSAPQRRANHTAVWTGTEMIIWGGSYSGAGYKLNTGARYNPVSDMWVPLSTAGAPEPRDAHSAVWTGSEMVVWGGVSQNLVRLQSGGKYDPVTDTWTPTNMSGAPEGRSLHTAVWTGSEMIVWGGQQGNTITKTGGRYDPATDTWSTVTIGGAPSPRYLHTAVWTGSEMIVWGGWDGSVALDDGGRYDPMTDRWSATAKKDRPAPRRQHTAVWTGTEMIVWGGYDPDAVSTKLNTGARYDPVSNRWAPMTITGAPRGRYVHTAVWTGTEMIVWGGFAASHLNTGGRYDPATDSWAPTFSGYGPEPRSGHTAIWTGSEMIVWGGTFSQGGSLNTGGRYDPVTDAWTPTSLLAAPAPRWGDTAIWTGHYMVVWGGQGDLVRLGDGGRYDPVSDTWLPVAMAGAPSPRLYHSAVWTDTEMIVWGGSSDAGQLQDGRRYDPETDTWTPMSGAGVPEPREKHQAVWTGSEMIVWGGMGLDDWYNEIYYQTGGRYNPATDTWTPMTVENTPIGRENFTAVWTGTEMIVWGGSLIYLGEPTTLETGGRYDPATDTWQPTSLNGEPQQRDQHAAVWTGKVMVLWGGYSDVRPHAPQVGGRYDPDTDSWTTTSTIDAPLGRSSLAGVWTGKYMIVWGGFTNTGGRYDASLPDADQDGFACDVDCDDGNPDIHPGAAEVCNEADDNCDGTVDEGFPVPGGVVSLAFDTSASFSWQTEALADRYDTVKGDLMVLRSGGGDFGSSLESCLEDDGTDTTGQDVAQPPAGAGFYYLVRAERACKAGTYGTGSAGEQLGRDSGIATSPQSCP